MSLGCFECKRDGAFNTLILFEPTGNFDISKNVFEYSNYYVCHDCLRSNVFQEVEKSRFMIVVEKEYSYSIFASGEKISETKFKLINEEELEDRLPNIFTSLTKTKFQRMVARFLNISSHDKLLTKTFGVSQRTLLRWKNGENEPHPNMRVIVEDFIRNHKCKCE